MKIGIFGVGLHTYWPQFPGLHQRLLAYQSEIVERISREGLEIIDAGLVDSIDAAQAAARLFASTELELVFVYVATYSLSSTVLPVVQGAGVPVVVLNMQPTAAIDYEKLNSMGDRGLMTGEWLANCQACSAPELANVFNRVGIDYHLVTGYLDDPLAWSEIDGWIEAARVASVMRHNRIGVLGHYYSGMLDVYSDLTRHAGVFGCHFELLEMDQLQESWEAVDDTTLNEKLEQFAMEFEVAPECSEAELKRAARTSCALDRLVSTWQLGSLAYYYEGSPDGPFENLATSIIAGSSLLTAHNIPVAGEGEIKNVQAMKILDTFGAGGSFSEFYAMDFDDDVVLMGHDGPGHVAIAEGPVKLVPLPVFHGKPGQGLSIQMSVKHGPVTLLSVVENASGQLSLLVAEGESKAGPILELGNTNSRYAFSIGARSFIDQWCRAGPSHHCAIGVGHIASKLEKLASLKQIKFLQVC